MPTKKNKKTGNKKAKRTRRSRATLVSLLLDESSSMTSCKPQTISGFNEYLVSLGNRKYGEVLFTLTKFNSSRTAVVYAGDPVSKIAKLTDYNYTPDSTTPLLDAIGKTIVSVQASLNSRKDKPAVLVVIMTDGQENASREYTKEAVNKLIDDKKKEGWTFVFLAAGQDAIASAAQYGIAAAFASSYDTVHTGTTMRNLSAATTRVRSAVVKGTHTANEGAFFTAEESASNMSGNAVPAQKKNKKKGETVITS
jgi:uncharacterized protein with von Willebrand factor type A (vWA) domain